LQKHLFREMKLAATAVRTPEVLKWNALNKIYAPMLQVKAELGADADDVEGGAGAGAGEKDSDGPGPGVGATVEIPTKNPIIVADLYCCEDLSGCDM
jgi:general transcription factor 3C polypeptide 3 (transcription factor C subunit 4)